MSTFLKNRQKVYNNTLDVTFVVTIRFCAFLPTGRCKSFYEWAVAQCMCSPFTLYPSVDHMCVHACMWCVVCVYVCMCACVR